jgi:hypothetical protein
LVISCLRAMKHGAGPKLNKLTHEEL